MTAKQSIKAAVRDAKTSDAKQRKTLAASKQATAATLDSFVNFAQKLGVGADNALSTAGYGYNPVTRNRTQLEWMHRGSWLGGVAVDTVADDMTRAGVEFHGDTPPDVLEVMDAGATEYQIWNAINETIAWSRLYGGAIAVLLIDGQDPKTPLRLDTVGQGQFKGLLSLDRHMVEPSLEDLVTEYGPSLGLPRYYRVQSNAPALRGAVVHYSRCVLRLEGIKLPYNQRLTENLWGISVLERLYDRMIAFDSASTGAAQLVYKSYLRTLKVEGMRDIVSAGGAPMTGLLSYVDIMRRFQGQEGITLLDAEDTFEVQQHSAFSGLSDALNQFGQQLSGALQIPLVRLFGQSPAGLNSTGENDMRMYYDHINQQQVKTLHTGVTSVYKAIARSNGYQLPSNFNLTFKNLWQLSDNEKATIAGQVTTAVSAAHESGLIGRRTALTELRQASKVNGVFSNITDETIEAADDETGPPESESLLDGMPDLGAINNEIRPQGLEGREPNGSRRRIQLQQ
jgi:uncharacterized protein